MATNEQRAAITLHATTIDQFLSSVRQPAAQRVRLGRAIHDLNRLVDEPGRYLLPFVQGVHRT